MNGSKSKSVVVLLSSPAAHASGRNSASSRQGLTEEQRHLLHLLQRAHDAIIVRDVYGLITFWNRGAERMYGWTAREALGKISYDLLQSQFPEPFDTFQGKLYAENCWEGDLIHTRRDRTPIAIQSRQVVQRDDEGRPVAVLEINRDITQRRQTEEELRQMAARLVHLQDEERRRIARELHDSTAQTLSALAINLAIIQGGLNGNLDSKLSKLFSDTVALAHQAGDEIRNLSHLLHPPDLEAVGLLAAIRWHTRAFSGRGGIRVALDLPNELKGLSEDVKIALFRVLQESLTNVRRHSGSKTAKVRVAIGADHLTLEVQDQGKGIPAGNSKAGLAAPGIGISGMRERIRRIGGILDIDSGPGGTTVRARVPVSMLAARGK
ncbi:MAG: PAS domain-containing sensor histidine kinase [Terriglobia bacterium]